MNPNLPTTIYSPDSSLASPSKMLRQMIRDLRNSLELARRLAVRDIMGQYRQALFGILWAVIMPMATTLTWVFLSKAGVVTVENVGLPYPLYVFTGTMLWAIFIDAINAPMQQVNSARGMLAKLNFPREALILSGIYQVIFNALIKVLLALAVLLYWQVELGFGLLLFPIAVASLVLAGTSIGLLLTPVGVLYTDVGRGLTLVLQFLMYTTPVVFPAPTEGWPATLFKANPLTPLITTARDLLTGLETKIAPDFMIVCFASAIILIVAWIVYRMAMPILVERMGG